jgi:hypothetical protein
MRRAMRRYGIYVVTAIATGCASNLMDPTPVAGPDVAGNWSGSASGATLSAVLDIDTCEFGCTGLLLGGIYSDNATHVAFTAAIDRYDMSPPDNPPSSYSGSSAFIAS